MEAVQVATGQARHSRLAEGSRSVKF